MSIHLVMPMGGKGSRFAEKGFDCPKPLIMIHGKPFFYWAVQSVRKFILLQDITFVVLQEHIDQFQIDRKILGYYPEAKIVTLPQVLNGAVLTCLKGCQEISDNQPILFNDCDHMFRCTAFEQFCNGGDFSSIDAGLLTFHSNEPKYSFLCYDENGFVCRTVEKQVISSDAICGAYYFKDATTFRISAEEYLLNCNYKEFYVSGVYNILAGHGKRIKGFKTDFHIPFGVPEEYEAALRMERFDELI